MFRCRKTKLTVLIVFTLGLLSMVNFGVYAETLPAQISISGYIAPDFAYASEISSIVKAGFKVECTAANAVSTADSNGYFVLQNIPQGSTNITLKISKPNYLSREIKNIDTNGNIQIGSVDSPVLMWAGDVLIDNIQDNAINMADIMELCRGFNSSKGQANYSDVNDLNKDNAINMADIMIIAKNFNKTPVDYPVVTFIKPTPTQGPSYTPTPTSTTIQGAIYVAPSGTDANPGTLDKPTTLLAAIKRVLPGGTIILRGGIYSSSAQITIERGNDGAAGQMKKIFAFENEKPILDFSSQPYGDPSSVSNPRGLQINGHYWHVKGLEVKGSADNGIYVAGNYNIIERCETHHNKDTGLQIGRHASTATSKTDWPSYNLILNCDSHDNMDTDNGEDADGFACKLTTGPGNTFRGCISYFNVDDGWDLYTKSETGAIDPVTFEDCIAYNNGQTSEGSSTTNSDGNGFKLGGEKISVNHIVKRSIAFNNKKHGFTYNSNPGSIQLTNCTSYNNKQSNFAFDLGTHVFTNNLSYKGASSDKTSGTDVESTNVWWKNNASVNAKGLLASDADFISLTPSVKRNADGTIGLDNFLALAQGSDLINAGVPSGTDIGARESSGIIPQTPTNRPSATPTTTVKPTSTPVSTPTSTPIRVTPSVTVAPTPTTSSVIPTGPVGRYSLSGFSAGNAGGGTIAETDSAYRKVTNASELALALKRGSGVKVVEIMNDLDLGWNEIPAAAKVSPFTAHNAPLTHPVLLKTGVSKITVDEFNGLTIFSANGAKIKHAAIVFKRSSNVVIRNLKFDELWEWDESTKGNYDKNDWDFLCFEECNKVWVDHCSFFKAYDGVLDVKKGTSNVTVSWCRFDADDRSANSWVTQQFNAMEANMSSYPMYAFLRSSSIGLSKDDIIAITAPQKKGHLIGATEFATDNANLSVTLHHNYYKDMQDRMPRLRAGNVHVYNIVMDSADAWAAKKKITSAMESALSSKGYKFSVTSNGAISTESGAVLVEKSHIIDVGSPIRNNQTDPSDPSYTGKILAKDTIYSKDGSYFRGNSDAQGSPLAPVPAPVISFSWNGFTNLPYSYTMDEPDTLKARLSAADGAGAGKLSWIKQNWLKSVY